MNKFLKQLKANKWKAAIVLVIAVAAVIFVARRQDEQRGNLPGLKTDTQKTSVDLSKVVSGGPGKDGIPAINDPKFVNFSEAGLDESQTGILFEFGNDSRFYPFNILVWHEVVNDSVNGKAVAVTFCPLCASAIVFDRNVNGETLEFGVSGLLYESNLLMYDRKTESLWSQAGGEAVVGDYPGTKLIVLPMQQLAFAQVKENHPNARVLSQDTGHIRNYRSNPYSGYESREDLIFPVSISDKRFPSKEVMYVVPFEGKSYAFAQLKLREGEAKEFSAQGTKVTISRKSGEINVFADAKELPGYYEMWFSWATHHQEDGVVWEM